MAEQKQQRSPFLIAFFIWLAVTLLVAASVGFIYQRLGTAGFEIFISTGPHSILAVTMISVSLTWALAGMYLYLIYAGRVNAENLHVHAGFLFVALTYLNVMRERSRYGDIDYYIEAATALYKGKPLPDSYFYPPLWATILKYFVPRGEEFILAFVWTLNILSLFIFYFLLRRVLEEYDFAPRMATAVTVVFMIANTTILRTLGYMQVNLHMLDFIFLALLLFRPSRFFSAFFMALAVYLKASPVILALAFLLELDWRWMGWFAFHALALGAALLWLSGIQPYLDFLHNYSNLIATHTPIYHDNSFDSFFLATTGFLKMSRESATCLSYAAKVVVGVVVLWGMRKTIRDKTFYDGNDAARLRNSLPLLALLMTLAAPLIWEHHGVILTLPFLLMLRRLDSPATQLWFALAYFLQYILPTFDFYPWSYGRLFAPLLLLWLILRDKHGITPGWQNYFGFQRP